MGDGVVLVALTGFGQPEDRERALAAGFDRHLTKPPDAAAIEQCIREAAAKETRNASPDAASVAQRTSNAAGT